MGRGKIFVTWIYKNLRSGVVNSKLIYITLIFYILSLLKYHNPTSSIFKNLSYKNFPSFIDIIQVNGQI